MSKEQNFMMLFRFTPNFEYRPTAEELAKMQEQWGAFIGGIALKEKLISTYRLGFEGAQISPEKTVSEGIVIQESQTVSGNMVVRANSLKEATEMAKDCPIILMGGTVEVRTILPMDN